MGPNVSEYLVPPTSGMLIPIYQPTKCHISYRHNAGNTHGQGIIKSHILNIVSNAFLVRCKRLLNPVLSIHQFKASQSYPIHKMQLIIFMYNYHTVLSYSVSIHTLNASLMSQNSCLSIQKKEVPITLVPNICFSTYMGPNVSAKNVQNSQTSYPIITSVDQDFPTGKFQSHVLAYMKPNY